MLGSNERFQLRTASTSLSLASNVIPQYEVTQQQKFKRPPLKRMFISLCKCRKAWRMLLSARNIFGLYSTSLVSKLIEYQVDRPAELQLHDQNVDSIRLVFCPRNPTTWLRTDQARNATEGKCYHQSFFKKIDFHTASVDAFDTIITLSLFTTPPPTTPRCLNPIQWWRQPRQAVPFPEP